MNNLPTVLVLTVPKTGSTSFYYMFRDNPDICVPLSKETWFFQDHFDKGLGWLSYQYSHWNGERVICDFVSTLIYAKGFTKRIKKYFKDIKFIFLIRDPVERCISHYYHEVRCGNEKEKLPIALKKEELRIRTNPGMFSHIAYKGIGALYKSRLQELFDNFSKEQIHVVLLEELEKEENNALKKIWEFLCIEPIQKISFYKTNVARIPKNRLLNKILSFPEGIYHTVQTNSIISTLVPLDIKRNTRGVRSIIGRKLEILRELSYKKITKPHLDNDIISHLHNYYRYHLHGLDVLINRNLSKYWPWYR